jgi:hypothetical protein
LLYEHELISQKPSLDRIGGPRRVTVVYHYLELSFIAPNSLVLICAFLIRLHLSSPIMHIVSLQTLWRGGVYAGVNSEKFSFGMSEKFRHLG